MNIIRSAGFSAEENSNLNSVVCLASAIGNKSPSHTERSSRWDRWTRGSFWEKPGRRRSCPERSCKQQSELPPWLNLLVHVTSPLYTWQTRVNYYYVDSLHADFYLFMNFLEAFCCLGIPRSTYFSFFLFKSVSHFGIMQANPSQCDDGLMIIDRSSTLDNWKCDRGVVPSCGLCWKSNKQRTRVHACPCCWSKPESS